MTCRITIFFISIFASLATYAAQPEPETGAVVRDTAALEAKYFEMRAATCRSAEKMAGDYQGIEKLELPLRLIIGTVNVAGFPDKGRVSNEPALDGNPCEIIEGLDFGNSEHENLFVTTKGLLDNYLMRHPKLPKAPDRLFKSDEFYFAALKADAALTNYARIPVKRGAGQDFAYAFLGGFAQDIGPFIPDEIIVVVSAKNRVYVISAPAKAASIPECQKTWDDFSARADEALEKYRESGNKNDLLFDAYTHTQDKGFVAYYTCFRQKAKTQPFFAVLVEQAQLMVNRLPSR